MKATVSFLVCIIVGCLIPAIPLSVESSQRIENMRLFRDAIVQTDQLICNPPPGQSITPASRWNPPFARSVTNVIVGSYYFPVIIWETGTSWYRQSLFSFWDDQFQIWNYPDSFTTGGGNDTGRGTVVSDSHGNLHFVWHQFGDPDGYEIYYTRALLDTSAGVIQYNVERPATKISSDDGEEDIFPSMCINNDKICIVWNHGPVGGEHAIYYSYDSNGGVAYEHGTAMPASWLVTTSAPDLTNDDVWVALAFDSTGDGSLDLLALHYDASDTSWNIELAAAAPTMHPYCLPGIAVDADGIPHIVFQENLTNTGGTGGLSGWDACGPAGTLYYTGRIGGNWNIPLKLLFPRFEPCNYITGYPSVGITDDCVYFSVTQPESALIDTTPYLPFNVYYACYNPYSDTLCYGDKVNEDSFNCFWPHIIYHVVYTIEPSGAGIAWGEGSVSNPFRAVYKHVPLLCPTGIEEAEREETIPKFSLRCSPNPFATSTTIHLAGIGQRAERMEIQIYDLSGRLVRNLSLPTAYSLLPTGVAWDGRDSAGRRVAPGIYFVKLKYSNRVYSRKVVRIE